VRHHLDDGMTMDGPFKKLGDLIDDLADAEDADVRSIASFLLIEEVDKLTRQGVRDAVDQAVACAERRLARQLRRLAPIASQEARRAAQIVRNTRRTLSDLQQLRRRWAERAAAGARAWDDGERAAAAWAATAAVERLAGRK
jgi:hypothetical protein